MFFNDVRVPYDSLVGEINQGWSMAKALLGFERINAFRLMVREWIAANYPQRIRNPPRRLGREETREWYLLLSRQGCPAGPGSTAAWG